MGDELDDAALLLALEQAERAHASAISPSTKLHQDTDGTQVTPSFPLEGSKKSPGSAGSVISSYRPRSDGSENGDLDSIVRKYFGFDFRHQQREVVEAALKGRDVGVYWATGSGKSLCYLLPSFVTGKITIVISPLISLMEDQVRSLNQTVGRGREELAIFLGSGQLNAEKEKLAFEGAFQVIQNYHCKLCKRKLNTQIYNFSCI